MTSDAQTSHLAPSTPSPAAPHTLRARVLWTLGHLLLLAGAYLLLLVGGLYAEISYSRMAARGDSPLPVPQAVTTLEPAAALTSAAPLGPPAAGAADAFQVPVLHRASQVTSAPPVAATAAGSTVSRIVIPSIDVDYKTIEVGWDVQEQDGQQVAVWQVAEYAVGHHRGSANPGAGGNVVLAGHVGGYGKVFRDLFYVQPGDHVHVYSAGQQYLYVVQERLVLDEIGVPLEQRIANARAIEPTDHELVTLVTCWPASGPDRYHQRVIVRALPYDAAQQARTAAQQQQRWVAR